MNIFEGLLAKEPPKNGRYYTMAIDGRGGSGKTTLSKIIRDTLPGFTLLAGDDYFEPISSPDVWGDFNDERFIKDVVKHVQTGDDFIYKPYDWHATPNITDIHMAIEKGLILERCYSFDFDIDWDLKIWVETPKEICLSRGLARELMPPEEIIKAWTVWQAAEDTYIQNKHPEVLADYVIDGTSPLSEQLTVAK
jgi:uridine kinase